MKGIFLLLGTNLGDRLTNLQRAKDHLTNYGLAITDYSSIYESAPWGDQNQGWFLNMILRVETVYEPVELLNACMNIELAMGRRRMKKWGERIIDVDVLYYHNQELATQQLTIPHPGIAMRRFTLLPMAEIAPLEKHPVLNLSQQQMLDICPDSLECHKTSLEIRI